MFIIDERILSSQLPMLKIDDKCLVQTGSIVRYLARRSFMLGGKMKEAAKYEAVRLLLKL